MEGSGRTHRPTPARSAITPATVVFHPRWRGGIRRAEHGALALAMITNRGVKVWPRGLDETLTTDHWRCRYMAAPGKQVNKVMIAELQLRLARQGVDFIKTERLCTCDDEPGYSPGQGGGE